MKKVQVAWFASPLAGIEPVQSGVTMAVSSTGFQLATCSESGERERERERPPVSVECFAQVALCSTMPLCPLVTQLLAGY